MSNAARNCQQANDLIARMSAGEGSKNMDMMTALKKYVEDACASIKKVDDKLKRDDSSLDALLFEIPSKADDKISWRNLIGRRDVIAHQLLTVDNEQVYQEAVRDFGLLGQLISRVHFSPIKTDIGDGKWATPAFRWETIRNLAPATHGGQINVGSSLVFVFEDVVHKFVWFRIGRTVENKIALAASPAIPTSMIEVFSTE